MSLGFLGGLVQLGLGAYGAYKARKDPSAGAYEAQASSMSDDAEDRQKSLAQAKLMLTAANDPTNPQFQKLQGMYESGAQRSFVDALNEYRGWSQRYGQGIVNPDRRDETIARMALQQRAQGAQQAQLQAQQSLMQGAQGWMGIAGPANTSAQLSLAQLAGQSANNQSERLESAFGNIVGGLQGVSGAYGQWKAAQLQPATSSQQQNWPGQAENIYNPWGLGSGYLSNNPRRS